MMTQRQIDALRIVAEGKFVPCLVKEEDGAWYARWRGIGGDENAWIDEAVRSAAMSPLSADAEHQHHETLHDAWLMALRSRTGLVIWDDAECSAFSAILADWAARADDSAASRNSLAFTFVSSGGEFFIDCTFPKGRDEYAALGRSVEFFGPLRNLRMSADGVMRASLNRSEAELFLRSGARRLRDAGYAVAGCEVAAQITAHIDLDAGEAAAASAPLKAKLVVHVAGEEVDAEEIRFLLEQGSSLVFFRNRWIEVDRGILREALRALERADGGKLSRIEAIAFAQGIGSVGRIQIEEVRAHGWLRGLVNELRASGSLSLHTGPVRGFVGELRPYQARGVAWLKFLTDHGFGALLADDMGLGKTIQTIAWLCLQSIQSTGSRLPTTGPQSPSANLIVAPLSLISNWRHELVRFAPGLRVYVHHGDRRHVASGFRKAVAENDVVLTSYTLLVKDYTDISEVAWNAIVIDEAQTVKNADTRAARALHALGAPRRIALTGTPVENSVSDIWSLENFLNPGFLPDRKTFAERFSKPLAIHSQDGAAKRLRHALEPFVLRRLKSDPEIAAELGEKREIREYCELMPRERADYEAALEDYRASERMRGDIFTLITRLKLVCDGEGKMLRLFDLIDAIFDAGESALVFTQYAKVGKALKDALEKKFPGKAFPFMHGALSPAKREEEISRFNAPGPSAFILSLRTGGFGLNLTKATHVIHFDRWWNPAVEAQATDRAHRIGQSSTVFVHVFITSGTIEERVDEILERKLATAGSLVSSGESFLAQMSPEEFEKIVRL